MKDAIIIREVVVRRCNYAQEFRGSYTGGSRDPDLVFLFVTISDGSETGCGECVSTSLMFAPGSAGRSCADEWTELCRLCAQLPGQDARKLGRLFPAENASSDMNSVLDAIDFALHDLVGRRLGMPVATLLGGIGRQAVWGMPVVYLMTPDEMAARAGEWYRRYGFRYFKLKPIGTLEADLETLRKMRERTASHVRFYMDANYHLGLTSPEEIADYLNALHEWGLEVYEDPVEADLATYRAIREKSRVKIMIDVGARTVPDIMRVIENRAADLINIHANWAGGFQNGLRKAAVAAAGGVKAVIGSTHYLGPGAAAYQILSSVLPGDLPCEQLSIEVYGMKGVVPDPYEIRDGRIHIRDARGLGVNPDWAALEARTVRREVFAL